MPTVTVAGLWVVAGCGGPTPPASCLTAQFMTSATRLTSNGQALLLMDGKAVCAPSGAVLLPLITQTRVTGI